jgi:hypothetical protein
MELERTEQRRLTPVGDTEREAAVGALQRAAAEGRLRLEEFSDRVGTALAAETIEQLEGATGDLDTTPDVRTPRPVSFVVAVLGDRRQVGRWRLPGRCGHTGCSAIFT